MTLCSRVIKHLPNYMTLCSRVIKHLLNYMTIEYQSTFYNMQTHEISILKETRLRDVNYILMLANQDINTNV